MSTAPSFFHQWIIQQLYDLLGLPAKQQGLAFPVLAPIGVLMPGCDPVQPDFVLVLAEHASIINDRRIRGVPDLIVEVLSPGSAAYDMKVKLAAYAAAGVPEYAIIDPGARTVSIYKLDAPGRYAGPRVASESQHVTFDCLPQITVPVEKLFAGAPDMTL